MKLCTLCRWFEFSTDEGSSCPTCGYEGSVSLGCEKKHWGEYGLGIDQSDFYRGIRRAATCADFDPYTEEEIAAL